MKLSVKVLSLSLALALSAALPLFAQTWTTSTIQNVNGVDYELWNQNNVGTVSMKITGGSSNANGGTFEAEWSGTENVLFRSGKKWGASSSTTYTSLRGINLDFAATWSSTDNVKYLGVYGWAYYTQANVPKTRENGQSASFSNQIEYYIIQDRGSYNPTSDQSLCGSSPKGSATIDGIAYDFWICDRINQPMLTGNGNFKQFFSVPKSTSSHRQSGKISVSKHFEEWHKAKMYMDGPLYEVAMKVESYTGSSRNSNGNAKVTKALLTFGESGNSNEVYLTTGASPAGAGTITKSPNTSSYALNASVQVTATANPGWTFDGWSGDATGTANPLTVTMNADKTITAKFKLTGESTENLIVDGNFPNSNVIGSSASWTLGQGSNWGGGNSAATTSVSSNSVTINITTVGTETYEPQLVQYNIPLDKGQNYKLTFTAKADAARKIEASFQQAVDPWGGYASKTFDLTTSNKEYEMVFKMDSTSDPAAQFAFNMGQSTDNVTISNVKLVYTSSTTGVSHRSLSPAAGKNSSLRATARSASVNVNFRASSSGEAALKLYSLKGDVISTARMQTVSGRNYSHTFNPGKLPNGFYVVGLQNGGAAEQTRVVIPK